MNPIVDVIVNIILAMMMFGLGLGIRFSEIKTHFTRPKALIVGLVNQLVFTLIVGYLVIQVTGLTSYYAFGLMMVAAMPGGVSSALITELSKGDTALSLSLTTVSSLFITFVTLPFMVWWSMNAFLSETISFEIPTSDILLKLLIVVLIPLVAALWLAEYKAKVAQKIKNPIVTISVIGIIILGVGVFIQGWGEFIKNWKDVGIGCLLLIGVMYALGYITSKLFQLSNHIAMTIAIGAGFQNNNLAFALAISILGEHAAGIPGLLYGGITIFVGIGIVLVTRWSYIMQVVKKRLNKSA